jgi:hypothetical protein
MICNPPIWRDFCFYWVFMNMEVITEQRWDDEKVKDYISQFKTKVEFAKSPEYGSIYSFYRRNNDLETLQDLTSGLEAKQKNRDYDYVKNYISQFNTYEDFRDSPEYNAIHSTIYKNYGKETWAELISPLEKKRESWDIDKVKKYISRFNTLTDLLRSEKGDAIQSYIDRSYPGKWAELTSHLERDREDWTIKKIKDYVSQFESMYEFENSPKFKAINSYIYRQKNGSEIWRDVTSDLKRNIFKGVRKVSDILMDLGYKQEDIIFEKVLEGCFSSKSSPKKCYPLRFDVYIIDKDGKEICIEYDGKQHFESVNLYGGEIRFRNQIENDILKNKYTENNDIKLIRIGYKDFKNIENELKSGLESPKQLFLSSNYPKAGWNVPVYDIMKPNLKKEYIVTESQLKRIVEKTSDFMTKLRRRFNKKTMQDFIYHAETEFPKLCDQFDNEFEYADAVINKAIDDFIFQEELEPYVYSGDWNFHEQIGVMTMVCKDWFEDGLLGHHQTTCQDEFDDEDFDMMNEAVNTDLEPNKVIVKLFKFLNTQKSNYNNKIDLQSSIKNYLPYFGIEADFAPYILELYLLNYRQDGDYSSLTKDNFIDPRKMKGKRTPNYNAKAYTKAQLPFEGSNLRGYWRTTIDGKIYVVESYGWYPVYIFKDGKWYEASDRYSSSTGKQMYASQPYRWNDTLDTQVYLLSRQEMEMIERGATHEKVMELKRKAFRDMAPSLVSQKVSTAKSSSYGMEPKISIKFKISSVEDIDDKNVVNVDIQDVLKMVNGKQVPTPENYLKGEIPNLTPEKVEKQIEVKLRNNFQDYLGPKFSNKPEEENIVFRFNHLKK